MTGITWWDVGAAFVALPAMATLAAAAISAMERRRLRQSEVAGSWVRSTLALALVIGVGTAVTFVTAVDGPAIWVFLGLSILIAAVRGDAACEVIALPNALAGRKDSVGCVIYASIDAAEARRTTRSRPTEGDLGRPARSGARERTSHGR